MSNKSFIVIIGMSVLAAILIPIAIYGAIGYVVVHFVTKFW